MNEVPRFLRLFYLQDVYKIRFWEKYYWSKADRLFAVSEEDREAMVKLVPKKKVGIIPNGVDGEYFSEKKIERKSPPRVLYGVTNFEWMQNQEATEILIKEAWPKIKKGFPKARVWIVGRKMPEWLKKIAKERIDIEITENIPDARDAYRTASVMVAPIKGAGGTRLKILEAMASGLPVVSTTIGLAGLKVKDGENVLIADTPAKLAEKAVMLLRNPKKAKVIGEKGRQHVRKYFDWMSVVKLHDPIYEDLMKKKYE
jgi:glycosyltransferase involved in cell wall biosynthesis